MYDNTHNNDKKTLVYEGDRAMVVKTESQTHRSQQAKRVLTLNPCGR